ncbi:MAG TPA: PEP/pyruvate-binding domain-containing protein, partial [Roseiflexaceae bacterium]|nr:PEP/pyruvate-binding domain-containing protein [Roseiflexaceae bacterium]
MNRHETKLQSSADALVLSLGELDRSLLPLVGGKAAQLGELIHAGFAVPAGFCVTTTAYARVSASAEIDGLLAELSTIAPTETARLAELATAVRAAITQAPVASNIAPAILEAHKALGQGETVPVAVRSSATAEDLPDASFAGQQETFLNVVGAEAVLDAVRRCWGSLWTDRAVSYRATHGIDPRAVRLAVVVQRMVDAQVAGVLFTANPLSGKRRQAVIDANPGLGEAVVSGATTPDHFVAKIPTGEIVERRLGDKQLMIRAAVGSGTQRVEQAAQFKAACLSDAQVRALAAIGAQVEASFGMPQDIEWAFDVPGQLWLLQARPITTLFPLPQDAPRTDAELRVYLCFNLQQGTAWPFTPIGISAMRVLASAIATLLGYPPPDPLRGPQFVTEAASRVFLDVTGALRSSFGRAILTQVMGQAEVHAATIFQQLSADPRLSLVKTRRLPLALAIGRVLIRTRLPWHLLQALLRPRTARTRLLQLIDRLRATTTVPPPPDPRSRVAAAERLLSESLPRLLAGAAPAMLGGMGSFALASKLLGDFASEDERQGVVRGLPNNPTTEMNLALWAVAQAVRADPPSASLVQGTAPAQLSDAYRSGSLPAALQHGLAQFLALYGHRSVNELDMGAPRWSDDPTYLFGLLASYLQFGDSAQAPDRQFQRAAEEAQAMLVDLTRRAERASLLRGLLAGFFLRRARALGGLREMPRFALALLLAQAQMLLSPVGQALVQSKRLAHADDILFLSFPEIDAALDGADFRSVIGERRARHVHELVRRQVPLVLLSDGTAPTVDAAAVEAGGDLLQGTPASPGRATGAARVILDPHAAQLAHGEILVAP